MIEEILKDFYKLEIPLPGSPLKALNSYVIRSSERNLIVDAGMNRVECMKTMQSGLRELGVDLRKTDFFITHRHTDHLGLVSRISTDTSTVYFNQPDTDWVRSHDRWNRLTSFALVNGFSEHEIEKLLRTHPGHKYGSGGDLAFTVLKEGDTLRVGEYLFTCIETPGHTKGHMCLYERNKKLLVAGDHLLNDITPNIALWSDNGNPLKEYLISLDKVYKYAIELVLPGHRGIFNNHRERIRELKQHHKKRTEEVLSILKGGRRSAFQVASQMSWDVAHDSWNQYPVSQKWFATGEAIAHLKYLEVKGMVRRERRGQKVAYSLDVRSTL